MTRYSVRMPRGVIAATGVWSAKEAADYIVRHGSPRGWTIVAQDANLVTATTPFRDLRPSERAEAAEQGFIQLPQYDPWATQIRRADEVERDGR
jgi:hypothetical protein